MLAFVGESRALQGYSSSLKVAQKLAFKDQVNSALEPLWHELKLLHKQAENIRTWNAERISDYTFNGNDTGSQTKYTVQFPKELLRRRNGKNPNNRGNHKEEKENPYPVL
ncbi:hypothetical protein KIW84_043176 [Lathyrus oleraceus]|uniref:Uncharacterized protein n=1 Tax=Pisum sativum TaxID=3888 RepID=A0A9D4XEI1_PEA|nr:hypothetical protein KIW84_043176 [Pisum sativum]